MRCSGQATLGVSELPVVGGRVDQERMQPPLYVSWPLKLGILALALVLGNGGCSWRHDLHPRELVFSDDGLLLARSDGDVIFFFGACWFIWLLPGEVHKHLQNGCALLVFVTTAGSFGVVNCDCGDNYLITGWLYSVIAKGVIAAKKCSTLLWLDLIVSFIKLAGPRDVIKGIYTSI